MKKTEKRGDCEGWRMEKPPLTTLNFGLGPYSPSLTSTPNFIFIGPVLIKWVFCVGVGAGLVGVVH